MYYDVQLRYMMRVLGKLHVPVALLEHEQPLEQQGDLYTMFGLAALQRHTFGCMTEAKGNRIYRLTDDFDRNFLYLLLPASPEAQLMIVGPYLTHEPVREQLMEMAERLGLAAVQVPRLEEYFTHVTVLRDLLPLMTLISTFAEELWGGADAFEIVDAEQETFEGPLPIDALPEESADIQLRMRLMETRYAYENELMELVRQGHHHRAELMLASFSAGAFEHRVPDPVRDLKNYGIICNTLMRKAAEWGGVHPVQLDRTSSYFARKIETVLTMDNSVGLMTEMVRSYCRLVRKHTAGGYTPPVQKAVAYIAEDLAGDLSLHTLAGLQGLSPGYLSTIFRKETGQTLTDYVNEKRMDAAARLLRTTRLQVQTVAQHCGMLDINYFSKMFKKYKGMTPRQFREQSRSARK